MVPMFAATAFVGQGLAQLGKTGSQLLFIADTGVDVRDLGMDMRDRSVMTLSDMGVVEAAQKNFISITNMAVDDPNTDYTTFPFKGFVDEENKAVTVLVQYYNDEMALVLWYLRVLTSGATVLVDAFDHEVPGTVDEEGRSVNVKDVLFDDIPAMSNDKRDGFNSGRFVIAVTAVGAVSEDGVATRADTLFPDFLAEDLHEVDNIDAVGTDLDPFGSSSHEFDETAGSDETEADNTTKNVGDLTVDNAQPVGFNYLTGHHTVAQIRGASSGSDQTASWATDAIARRAYQNLTDLVLAGYDAYYILGRSTDLAAGSNRTLEDVVHGGVELTMTNTRDGYTSPSSIVDGTASNRAIGAGALGWASLHGDADQMVQFLSVADDFGVDGSDSGVPGAYQLIAAKTGYTVVLRDNEGDALPDPAADDGPVFGGVDAPEDPASINILVDGIRVTVNADPDKCGDGTGTDDEIGTMISGAWSLADLVETIPSAAKGDNEDFAGLEAEAGVDPMANASRGSVEFLRGIHSDAIDYADDSLITTTPAGEDAVTVGSPLTCEMDYGDGDSAHGSTVKDDDGVPTTDERIYKAGTLVVEEQDSARDFVTVGRVVLKFATPDSTFGASWWLTEIGR